MIGSNLVSRRAFVISAIACQHLPLRAEYEARPVLNIRKSVFAQGEQIRIWVGVTTSGRVPDEKQKPGLLHIIHPDGSHESRPISWPVDGPAELGWKGGVTLADHSMVIGKHRLSFEWDHQQSPEAELTVCEWNLKDRVVAHWLFNGGDLPHATATLSVENRSNQVLRFCRLGMTGADVWLSVSQDGPHPSRESLPFSWKELLPEYETYPNGDADEARWQHVDDGRIFIKVEPHSNFSQTLAFAKVNLQFPVSSPEVEISAVLTLFLGEAGDTGSVLYPVRADIRGKHRFS